MHNDKIVVAIFGRPHGIKGGVRLKSFTMPEPNVINYKPLLLFNNNDYVECVISGHVIFPNGRIVVNVEGFNSPESVRELTNKKLYFDRSLLPDIKTGQYYWHDLEECLVKNYEGKIFGRVSYLFDNGANDVMFIVDSEGKEIMIPFISHIVQSVDINLKIIVVDWV